MEPVTTILGGLVIAGVSSLVTKYAVNNDKVKQGTCEERRLSCSTLIGTKIDNLAKDIKDLKDVVQSSFIN